MIIHDFYQTAVGRMACGFLWSAISPRLCGLHKNGRILLLGAGAAVADAVMQGTDCQVIVANLSRCEPRWPKGQPHNTVVVDPHALPFGDVIFDHVVVLHGLEYAPLPEKMMGEIQRVLTAEGQATFIVPNRTGIWAWFDHTPWGEGRTFSPRQMRRLVRDSGLSPIVVESCLFVPPVDCSFHAIARGLARLIENVGCYLRLGIGGVVLASARKQRYAGVPVKDMPVRVQSAKPAVITQHRSHRV